MIRRDVIVPDYYLLAGNGAYSITFPNGSDLNPPGWCILVETVEQHWAVSTGGGGQTGRPWRARGSEAGPDGIHRPVSATLQGKKMEPRPTTVLAVRPITQVTMVVLLVLCWCCCNLLVSLKTDRIGVRGVVL